VGYLACFGAAAFVGARRTVAWRAPAVVPDWEHCLPAWAYRPPAGTRCADQHAAGGCFFAQSFRLRALLWMHLLADIASTQRGSRRVWNNRKASGVPGAAMSPRSA
jgi:hypothetical protein